MHQLGLEFQKRLGVEGEGAELLKQMRAKTPAELMKAGRPPAKMAGEGTADHIFVDGYVLTEPIRKVFAEGRQANVPLIIGDVADEGTMFAKKLAFDSVDKYRQFLSDTFHEKADKIFAIYPAKDDASAFEASVGLCGDVFNRGTRTMARQTAVINPKTFMYRFTRISPLAEKSGIRCFHGCELTYLFGNVQNTTDYTDDDRKLSKQLVGYFTRFAKTGDPNGGGAPVWPAYTAAEDKHIVFDTNITPGEHMRKQTLDAMDELEK
jgi:para-nitrobenzyl esterase